MGDKVVPENETVDGNVLRRAKRVAKGVALVGKDCRVVVVGAKFRDGLLLQARRDDVVAALSSYLLYSYLVGHGEAPLPVRKHGEGGGTGG